MAAVAGEEREQVASEFAWRHLHDAARHPAKTTRCDYAVEKTAVIGRICGLKKIGKRRSEAAKAGAPQDPQERDEHGPRFQTTLTWRREG